MPGYLYISSLDLYTDGVDESGNDCPKRWLRRCAHLSNEQLLNMYHSVYIDLEVGLGLEGAGQGSDPELTLDYSDDGGKTYKGARQIKVGKQGEFEKRPQAHQLGSGRDRVFRLTGSDPIAWRIVGGYVNFSRGVD
jgi:hypothetical protein